MEQQGQAVGSRLPHTVAQVLASVFGVLASFEWLVLGIAVVVIGAKFREIFRDFGVALPPPSLVFLRLAEHGVLVALLVAAAIGLTALAVVKRRPIPAILSFLLAGLVMIVFLIAMQAPLMAMVESLGSGGM